MDILKAKSNTTRRYGAIIYSKNKEWFFDFYFGYNCWLIRLNRRRVK